MRIIFSIFIFLTFQLSILNAQSVLFQIESQNGFELCPFECASMYLILDDSINWETTTLQVLDFNGIPVADVTQISLDEFSVCFREEGTFSVLALGTGIDQNQNTITATDTSFISVYFYNNGPTGEIISTFCVDSSASGDDCLKACEFSEVTYMISNGTDPEGQWFVQGASSYVDLGYGVEVVWGAAGTGWVSFIPFDPCNLEIQVCVEILPTPVPEFDAIPEIVNGKIQLCKGQPFYLENLSQFAARYEWAFGDGNVSELFEPEHRYTTEGTYTLTLTAFNGCECSASTSIEVEVLPAAAPELSCIATVCPNEKVRYVATTDGCQSFYWSVSSNGQILSGGGTTDDFIEIEWGSGPDGFIELLVDDCAQAYCSKPSIFRIPIVSENGPISGDQVVCSGELVTYKAPYFPGVTYAWTSSARGTIIAGQGTNAIAVQWDQVSSTITGESVEVSYGHCYLGCDGSDQFSVDIVPNFTVSGGVQYCENDVAQFISEAGFTSNTPISSSWSLIDEFGNEIWSSASDDDEVMIPLNFPAGTYTVIATASDPTAVCNPTAEKEFIITPLPENPIGILGDSFICAGLPYTFEINASGNYQTLWTITDGGNTFNYEGNIISHTFGNIPPYMIEAQHADLIYTSCISGTTNKLLFKTDSVEIIGSDENCFEEITIYEVYDLPGDIIEWRVEPSEMAEVRNIHSRQAEFYWTRSGVAQVILSVCGKDIVKDVLIHELPEQEVVHPVGLCKNELGQVSTATLYEAYFWRDSSGVLLSTDSMVALPPGYYISEVQDTNGCIGRTTFYIDFFPTPTARISTLGNTGHCNVVNPIELVANTDGVNYNFEWFHNGSPVGSNSPKLIATDYGQYLVEVTNEHGCVVRSNVITLFDWCGGSGGVCNGQTCNAYPCLVYDTLQYEIQNLDCNTKRYIDKTTMPALIGSTVFWDIEQSNGSYLRRYGQSVEHTYEDAGYYTVILAGELDGFVYSASNCHHLYAFKDTVELASKFNFKGACANQTISFIDLTTFLPDYGITNWAWDFGDGQTSFNQHPDHVYSTPGIYTVTLVTTSTSGCTSTVQRDVEVHGPPTISIQSATDACEKNPVRFEVNSAQQLFNIIWNFDDPMSANDSAGSKQTRHAYDLPGNYSPTVFVKSIYGCEANTSTSIEIHQNTLNGQITADPGTVICEGDLTQLAAPTGAISWIWNTNETTDEITTGTAGYYEVHLTDQYGCQYTPDPILVEVNPKPVAIINGREVFGPGDAGPWTDTIETCDGVDIELTTFANSDVDYLWSTTETTQTISFTQEGSNLLPAGTHSFDVVVTDKITGCVSDPVSFIVIVHDNPDDFTISIQSGTGCSESINILQVDNPQNNVTYVWSDGQVGVQIEAKENGIYEVVGTNEFGCTTVSTNTLSILESPRSDLFPSGCFVRCNPDTICIPDIPNVALYEIYLDNVLLESGTTPPNELIATTSGSYEIYLEGVNGCTSRSEVLDLELYPGFGHIEITVFVDVNNNQIIDAGDTTIRQIPVILSENGIPYNSLPTDHQGVAYFLNTPAGSYVAAIDTMSLPPNLRAIISNQLIEIVGCDMEYADSLLLGTPNDTLANLVLLDLCPGDSALIDGQYYYGPATVDVFTPGTVIDTLTTYTISMLDEINSMETIIDACDGSSDGQINIVANSNNGPVTISWDHTTSTDFELDQLTSGSYTYTLDDGRCRLDGAVTIGDYLFPAYDATPINPTCPGESDGEISITLTAPELTWSLDSISFGTNDFVGLASGDYTIYVTNGHCVESELVTLEEKLITPFVMPAVIDLPVQTTIQLTHNYLDSVNHQFNWSPDIYLDCSDCITPLFLGHEEHIEIHVLVTDQDGCEQDARVLIRPDQSQHIYIPNAFSPNDDAINDYFKPFVREGLVYTSHLEIFDRWGNKVYEEFPGSDSEDIRGWDGRRHGSYLTPGLFLYKANFIYINGNTKEIIGEVHLIR